MSTKGQLTKDQAIAIVGEAAVAAVEKENCDFTNRLQCDGDDRVEFAASVACKDADGNDATLIAYYYQTQDALDSAGDDLSNIDWTIYGYEIN